MNAAELDSRLIGYIVVCGVAGVLSLLSWQLLQRVVVARLSERSISLRQNILAKLLLGTLLGIFALWLAIQPALFSGAFRDTALGYESFDPLGRAESVPFLTLLRFFLFQGLAEELVYRGISLALLATGLFAAAARFLRPREADAGWLSWCWLVSGLAANLLVSLTFALWHGSNPGIDGLGVANIALAGMVLGQLFLNQGSVGGAAALHIIWNLGQALLGLPVSGILVSRPLIGSIEGAGLELISGGLFGPEGGLGSTASLLLVLAYLLWTGLPPGSRDAEAEEEQAAGNAEVQALEHADAD
ncbi:CPBP family intramembrane metalloprotease [bacterium]|nr:CPBP family intramembrane metalloprotease [bacterium]